MGSRRNFIALGGLALGVGGSWWLIPRAEQEDGLVNGPESLNRSVHQGPLVLEGNSNVLDAERIEISASLSRTQDGQQTDPAANLPDPEVDLSRELEYIVQRTIDATLDRGKHIVQSVTCRGLGCEARFESLESSAVSDERAALRTLHRDLGAASYVHPSTGAILKVQSLELRQARGDNPASASIFIKFEIR